MSGIAMAAPTTPGSVATFSSCSRDRSSRTASRIPALAKMRAGTRISDRAEAGISQSTSSSCLSGPLDIEDDRSAPSARLLGEREPVVGRGLDERARPAPSAHQAGDELRLADSHDPKLARYDVLRLGPEDDVVERFDEQSRLVGRGDVQVTLLERAQWTRGEELAQAGHHLAKDVLNAVRLDPQLDLGRVIHPLAHGLRASAFRRGGTTASDLDGAYAFLRLRSISQGGFRDAIQVCC